MKGTPTKMAANGVPQGWEQVPAIGTGIGKTEIRKMAAPVRPSRGTSPLASRVFLLITVMPIARKTIATPYQIAAQLAGRIPSAMCMA